jgi:hypothetical protein
MKTRSIAVVLLAVTLGWAPRMEAVAAEDVPTKIVAPVDPLEYPDPICTTCVVRTVKRSESDPQQAFVEIEYLDSASFEGQISLTVWLAGDRVDALVIPGVFLEHGDLEWYEVSANDGWSWDDVQKVSLELVPRQ